MFCGWSVWTSKNQRFASNFTWGDYGRLRLGVVFRLLDTSHNQLCRVKLASRREESTYEGNFGNFASAVNNFLLLIGDFR